MEFRAVQAHAVGTTPCSCRNCASSVPQPHAEQGEAPGPPDLGAAIRERRNGDRPLTIDPRTRSIEKWIQPNKENSRG